VVWSDIAQKVDWQILVPTDRLAVEKEQLHFQLPAAGKKWVRLVVYNPAVNGAFAQPVHLR